MSNIITHGTHSCRKTVRCYSRYLFATLSPVCKRIAIIGSCSQSNRCISVVRSCASYCSASCRFGRHIDFKMIINKADDVRIWKCAYHIIIVVCVCLATSHIQFRLRRMVVDFKCVNFTVVSINSQKHIISSQSLDRRHTCSPTDSTVKGTYFQLIRHLFDSLKFDDTYDGGSLGTCAVRDRLPMSSV